MNVAGASGETNSDKRRTKENQSLSPAAEAKVHKKVRENTKNLRQKQSLKMKNG